MTKKVFFFTLLGYLVIGLVTSQLCTVPETLRSCQPTCEFRFPPCNRDVDPQDLCQCDDGFILLNYENTTCVPIGECPSKCSKSNQFWNDCGSRCRENCQTQGQGPIPCVKICEPGCFCDEGLVLNNANMECVNPTGCPDE